MGKNEVGGPMRCGIAQRVGESSLYPALQRLLLNGWVKSGVGRFAE